AIDQLDSPLPPDVAVSRRHGNVEGMRAVVNAGRRQIRARTIGEGAADFAAVDEYDCQPLYGAVFSGQPAEDLTRLLRAVDAPADPAEGILDQPVPQPLPEEAETRRGSLPAEVEGNELCLEAGLAEPEDDPGAPRGRQRHAVPEPSGQGQY